MDASTWRDQNAHRILSQDEVNELAEGAPIEVVWTGGNGPARYEVTRQGGAAYAAYAPGKTNEGLRLDFVGMERYHTQVALASALRTCRV
jgi:hypothetical protein